MEFTPMEVLQEMINAGWGNTPQTRIPNDWMNFPGPDRERSFTTHTPPPIIPRRKVRPPKTVWPYWIRRQMGAAS